MDDWLIIILTLLLSAFFSGMEIAFISANKLKTELDKSKGLLSAKILSKFNKTPSKLIGALLLGNNVALVIYGIAMAKLLEPFLFLVLPANLESAFFVLFCQTLIATVVILIVAEFFPKVIFRMNSNSILNFFAVPVFLFYYIFYPVIYLFLWLSKLILALINVKINQVNYVFSPVDLDNYFREFTPKINEEDQLQQEIQMFQNAIDFRKIKLRECMIPRTEIIALEENDSIENLKNQFIESGLSRILIFNDSIDTIIGYVHSFDIFSNPTSIKGIMKPIIIVPETMLANNVLTMFIQQNKSIAVIVDEFGGTSGMVTMEDIIEEIFGEIEDEFDIEEMIEKKFNKYEYKFSARLEIDYLNEKYKLGLPESEDYETLGGFILKYHESIPQLNEEIIIDDFRFIIIEASETRIETVSLKIIH
ncbi:hemolysin family protein [Bacteroidota bacterium]